MTAYVTQHNWGSAEVVASVFLNKTVQDVSHLKERGDIQATVPSGTAAVGDLVTPGTVAGQVIRTTTLGQSGPVWVAQDAFNSGTAGYVRLAGSTDITVAEAVTPGQYLQTSGTTGQAAVTADFTKAIAVTVGSATAGGLAPSVLLPWPAGHFGSGGSVTFGTALPGSMTVGSAGTAGAGTVAARYDHAHPLAALTASDLAGTPTAGARLALSSGTVPIWSSATNTSGFLIWQNTMQNHGSGGAFAKVLFDVAAFDNLSETDVATNHRFTASQAGIYAFSAGARVTNVPDGTRYIISIFINGAEGKRLVDAYASSGSTSEYVITGGVVLKLAASDAVELDVFHNAAGTVIINTGIQYTYLTGVRIV